jgi:hypothetical protein
MTNLAERAVKAKGWKWMAGMLSTQPDDGRPIRWCQQGNGVSDYSAKERVQDPETAIPVLSDPATIGCLLGLVREVHGDPEVFELGYHLDGGWWVLVRERYFYGGALGEALVAALEAAP